VQISSNTSATQAINSVASSISNASSVYGAAGVSRSAYSLMIGAGESSTLSTAFGNSISNMYSSTQTVVKNPQRYLNIPAEGDIIQVGFAIATDIYSPLDFPISNVSSEPIRMKFKKPNSPIRFTNNISYGFTEGSNDVKTIISKFWVSEVTNMFSKDFNGAEITRTYHDVYGNISSRIESRFPYASANSFYLYMRKPVDKLATLKVLGIVFCGPPVAVGVVITSLVLFKIARSNF
jgi:hypothetical protein